MERVPPTLLFDVPGTGRTLAFGLRWFALIGSNIPALARSRGRRLRASHYVVGGAPAMVAGYGRMRSPWRGGARAGRRRQGHIQAAAQLYALLYPDGGHSLISLPSGGHWLVAAQRGTVLSQADRVYATLDEALREQALLRARRPALPAREADEAWALLMQAADPAAQLLALSSRWAELPLAFRLFLGCVALAAIAPPMWDGLLGLRPDRASPDQPAAQDIPPQRDPYLTLLQNTVAHAPAEVTRLLDGFGRLPMQVRGWALSRARCLAGDQSWNCSAVYVRAHPQAANDVLHALRPAGWQVTFQPLEEATLSWRMASSPVELADLVLPTSLQVDTGLIAALQRMRAAFTSVILAAALPLPLPVQSQPAGQRVAGLPDAGQPGAGQPGVAIPLQPAIRSRAITLRGPLRSFALLDGAVAAARWSRLSLDIQAQPRPTLVSSTLVAELQGELYEQE
ncbi:hypothetical protein [Achromobacter sp. GD03932]|uniref:hypothetical protein n=1 Tax=Achromobacter sp. GD03932 TaxID=2975407 RepID=UPI00244AC5E2|nr:hypothetical protein [Achromobacter sp. GD03932]MDH1302922.1 hypothetical protein [Achromobacter sp. GD03932]